MDYNNGYEQEIDLKELMFAVLRKWRPILAAAVALAVVLGGYKSVSAYRAGNDEKAQKAAQKEYETELELYNKNVATCEREIENLTKDIANQQEYLEKSVLMNMSPYDVWEAKTELFVKTDYEIMPDKAYQNPDFTGTILQSYQSALTSAEFIEQIAKVEELDSRYLKELVSINVGRSDNKINYLLTIQVRHEDEGKAQQVLDEILDGVDHFRSQIRSSIGVHTISVVNSSVGSMVDLSLADQQKNENDRLIRLNTSLDEKQTELEGLEAPEPVVSSGNAAAKSGVKYGLIGGVLGAFAVIFFVCVAFVMSDKVYSAKELKYRFKLKILGTLPMPGAKKAGKIDSWLSRLEGRACDKDEDREFGLIAANICNYAEGAKNLLIVGSAERSLVEQTGEKLRDKLPGLKVISGGNLLTDAESLKKLPECDSVLLVEQCGTSLYSSVELEIEKARDLGKNISGCVVFE